MRAFFHPDQRLHDPQQFMRVGRIRDPKDLPGRIDALIGALAARGIATEAPRDYGLAPALTVHTRPYLDFLASAYERWRALPEAGPEVLPNVSPYWNGRPDWPHRPACRSRSVVAEAGYYLGDLAVPIGPDTWRSALASTHTAAAAADAVLAGAPAAYALCRPSGHHARADRATGFCYLNNSAIAAERLLSRHARVAVLDVDAHHGDGTQEVFYRRADVLTVSIHVDPNDYYPFYIGYADEGGVGEGEGRNINLPLAPGAADAEFHAAVDRAAERIGAFGAEALVVALGYDSHREDPIGLLKVSTEGFRGIGERVRAIGLPTVVVQEGGYQISVIGDCLGQFLHGLLAR
ncbi:histone deacetylase family protein [Chelatococcus sp. SYSU_G07232]|uniref:Histone deacetylase family protein n=1 Tax=Chelatococcus albus TaxID=3047466 RepID=A0ABT7AK48_9HYPH|nr:histone deacetylase family protein [Chelatococcus sp. SYSU_G07232]MDJ1159189.1 histone deacetylase family protein [Chelatococcus sp. SYSU_G07232]